MNGIGSSIYTTTRSTILAEFADYDEENHSLKLTPTEKRHIGSFDFSFQLYFNEPPTQKIVYNCVITVEGPPEQPIFDANAAISAFDYYFYYWLDPAARDMTQDNDSFVE